MTNKNQRGLNQGIKGVQPVSMDFPSRNIPEQTLMQGGQPKPIPETVEGLLKRLVEIQMNKPSFAVAVVDVDVAGTPERGPDIQIPDGATLTIRLRSQTGVVLGFVSNTSGGARNPNSRIQLNEGDAVGVKVQNMQAVWVDSDTNAATFEYIVEQ